MKGIYSRKISVNIHKKFFETYEREKGGET
jgi:hypothetical protein